MRGRSPGHQTFGKTEHVPSLSTLKARSPRCERRGFFSRQQDPHPPVSREKASIIWLLRVFPSGRRSIHHLLVAVVGGEFRDPLPELRDQGLTGRFLRESDEHLLAEQRLV